ncbi:Ig-like domain-containing protein [Bradyrhizobium genosp. A]|uniref:Ig-like domain-containing protein n=1 Tax=Bradyrhizobium genosp. A TaxID=83626 RepID=UPI003CEE2D34
MPGHDHVDSFTAKAHGHVPEGAVVIADPNLIFHGDFKRTGLDLVLSHDGHEFVVHDYFRGDKRAAIASPDGAHLTGDIVSALTGHVQYAQAAPGAAAAQVIGHVTKLTGSATAIRNGVSVILNNGDNVEKGDVVSTGSDSTLGVTFIDGTVFGLSSNARMVLNEMVYDPNGSNNSSLLSLVAGTITFVAGETAKHGDMKIDTPVATMGIRGTAVLTEINFVVPSGGGDPQPQANFQVLVEPNGTTGSYILFDKLTLLPIATVNQAGQMIQISGGNVSVTNALLSPDVQKLITDVFTLKFTDNNTNTKLTTNFTDTITQIPDGLMIKTPSGATAIATFTNLNTQASQGPTLSTQSSTRVPGPPDARSLDANGHVTTAFKLTEHANATGDRADTTGDTVPPDTIIFRVNFVDQNLGDQPTVSVDLAAAPNYVYTDAGHHDVTSSLTALQKQDIAATQIKISVVADAGNNNNGSDILTYTIPDHAFDFLAAGETLTLTYRVRVNNNFAVNPESSFIDITITITGTNDKPVITTSVPTITFSGGTSVPGGPLISDVPTAGTLTFKDVDLTDTHTVSVALTSASLPDGTVPPGPLAIFQHAMSVLVEKDSTQAGNNTGIIDWSLADLPAYVADFIPKGEVLTLTYTVTLTDSQGATSTQTITVTIKGTDSPAVVWIATKETGAPSGGLWGDKLNWETHTVPTINDDVMVITDQLRGLTPSYPVTIDAAAFAKSLIMDDYNTSPPELINNSTLTIAGALTLNADSKFTNSVGGDVLVGGKIDVEATTRSTGTVTNTSIITNAGTLTLAGGGTIDTRTTVSNSGMIDLSGGTLTLKSNVANVGGTLKADAGTTLIVDAATIDGGTVIILGTLELDGTSLIENGTLNNFATVNVKGAAEFASETVTNAGSDITIDAAGVLTLDGTTITGGTVTDNGTIHITGSSAVNGASVTGGSITVHAAKTLTLDDTTVTTTAITDNGTVKVDSGKTLTLDGTTVTGGAVTDNGTIHVTGSSAINGASVAGGAITVDAAKTLTLDDTTVTATAITDNGTMKIDAAKMLDLSGVTLTGGAVNNLGTVEIVADSSIVNDGFANTQLTIDSGKTLTLDGTTITGGTVTDNGTIHVTGSSAVNGASVAGGGITVDATTTLALDNTAVTTTAITDNGTVKVDSSKSLSLSGVTLTGGAISNLGTIEIVADSAIINDTFANNQLMIDSGKVLTLDGTTITGGTVTDNGTIHVTGSSAVNGASVAGGGITVDATTTLTLDNTAVTTTAIADNGTVKVDAAKSLSLSGVTLTGGAISNLGTIEIVADSSIINDALANNQLTIDSGKVLTLDGTTITGGAITDSGTIHVTGSSAVNGASVAGSAITVDAARTLTLDDTTVTTTAITDNGTVKVDAAKSLSLSGVTLTGGAISNLGTIEIVADSSIINDALANNQLTIDSGKVLTLDGTTITGGAITDSGTIHVTGSSAVNGASVAGSAITVDAARTLTLDDTTVTTTAITDNGTVKVDASKSLSLSGVTLTGGAISNLGTIEIVADSSIINDALANNQLTIDSGKVLTLDGTTITGGAITDNGTAKIDAAKTLNLSGVTLTGGAVNNLGTVEIVADSSIVNDGFANTQLTVDRAKTLSLSGVTLTGGAVNNLGTVEIIADSAIVNDALANNQLTIDSGKVATFDGTTITGGTITDNGTMKVDAAKTLNLSGVALTGGAINNLGTVEIVADSSIVNDGFANAQLTVNGAKTLTLDGTTITGGTVTDYGTVHITGSSAVNGAAVTGGAITVDATTTLTLDNTTVTATAITDNGTVKVDSSKSLSLSGVTLTGGAVNNLGTVEIVADSAIINDALANNQLTIDSGKVLTLDGTTVTGGTLTDNGSIHVTGDTAITGASVAGGGITVDATTTLTLDDTTVTTTTIANGGTVKVDANSKLTLAGASLTGGTLTVSGTLASSGTTTITDATISNSYLIEATLGGLLTLLATTPAAAITNGDIIQANGAELDINGELVTNTGTLAAINDGTLKLIATKVTNTLGTVSVDAGSTLDLDEATIDGGTVTISGTLESSGSSAINNANVTITGTVSIAGGTLTFDPPDPVYTIVNQNVMAADGGEIDVIHDAITNTGTLEAIHHGTLKLTGAVVTNKDGTVLVDATSALYLTGVTVNDGTLSNAGHLYAVSGPNTITAAVANTGTIEVQGGTLDLSGGLSGVGSLIIDDGATLELAGATAQTVTFNGGTDTLRLDKVAGESFSGTIAGQSSTNGTFTVNGDADITTSTGDALDFTAGVGTTAANIVLTPTGTLTGALNGVLVTQNGAGNISLTATGDITGLNGNGIMLRDSATGAGSITVNDVTGKATGTGANSVGVLVENLNAANAGDITITQRGGAEGDAYGIDVATWGNGDVTIDAGGAITGSAIYGIRARSYGAGRETVTTETGSVITSGSSGIVAVNRAISLDASNDSTITVNAYGTINSGDTANLSGNPPAGIQAGYTGSKDSTGANTDVNGTVVVNNYADITAAAGSGIDAYNYGNGDVTVNSFAGTTISVSGTRSYGIEASALSGGTGDISITLDKNVTITGATAYGIKAYSIDAGDISVTMATGDSITSGSSGIVAVNYATAIASGVDSTISVQAHGTIHSGSTSNNDTTTPGGIIAGYKPGGNATFSNAVKGDVTVASDAAITADAGYGIEAFTWGVGKVTVTTGALSSITAAGTAIGAFDHGGGNVSVTNEGSATGAVGLSALATGAGDVTIVNDGDLAGTSRVGISVTQDDDSATGSTHITNTGSVVGASGYAAISIHENATGTALIDNSGTIGPDDAGSVTATTYAIVETGGAITINNSDHINGNISVASATFDNESAGTWTVSGTGVFGTLSTIENAGEIDLLNGASVSSADGVTFAITNSGKIESWGTNSITGSITNTNTIEVHTGTLSLFGSLSGAGSVTIDANATLDVNATVSQTITFDAVGGKLQIDTASFGGSVAGFAATDKLDLSTIKYDGGTSATYDANTGNLVVSDAYGHSITVKLTGHDYSDGHFAGSSDGHGGTLITLNADDDTPAFTAAEASPTVSFSELANTTGSSALDPVSGGTGTIHFTDVDLTDRPTVTNVAQTVTWFDTDGTTQLTLSPDEIAALEHALTLQQTGKNNGAVGWSYSIADSALDFLGEGQTVKVNSTITLNDGHNSTDTAHVDVTIIGTNDAPKISYGLPSYLAFDGATAVSGTVSTQNTGNGSDGVSLQGWVNWSGEGKSGDSQLLFYNGSTSDAGFGVNGVVTDEGKLDLQIQNGGIAGIDTGVTIDANHAHNIALTHVDGLFTLYVDGVAEYTTTASVNSIPGAAGYNDFTEIGGVPTEDGTGFATEGFKGSISDVSIWSAALTQAQVQVSQAATLTGSESNLVGLFPLHDGGGTAVTNLASGGGNLGIHGNAAWIDAASGGVTASLTETDAGQVVHGTLAVSDADATDHVTVALDHVTVYLDGVLQADGIDGLSNADLLNYLTVQSGDILNGTATHAQFTWDFNSGSQAFDFLAAGQTLSLQYTIVPDDGHTATGTGNGTVTINIAGTNDAPTLDSTVLASVSGNDSNPTGAAVSDLFADKFHDVDAGASLKAIAVSADNASSDQGIWQYEITGTDLWVDIGSVDDAHALVLSPDTLLRFVPADGYTGTPGTLDVHALDDTYAGTVTTTTSPALIDISGAGHGGTTPVSDQAASISIDVTVPPDVLVANDDTIGNAATPSTADGWVLDAENGHFYRIVASEVTWAKADANAVADGAYLATVTSQGEEDFIAKLAGWDHVRYGVWSGGQSLDDNLQASSHWSWVTGPEAGSDFTYAAWRAHEPSGWGTETVAYMVIEDHGRDWNDVPPYFDSRAYLEEWGGQQGQVAFKENVGTTLTTAQLLTNDTDSAGNPINVTSVGDLSGHSAHGGAVTLDGNIISYTPATDYFGADSFTYTISDGVKTSTATVSFTVDQSPVIDTTHFEHTHNADKTDTITGLSVSGSSAETYTVSAVTAGQGDGSSVSPSSGNSLTLDQVNFDIASVTYKPGASPPANDIITFTVTNNVGVRDTVNFIFKEAGDTSQGITLQGTGGKDVIFATETGDTLIGGGGKDQFVFAPGASGADAQHTIVDFAAGLDKIDLRQFSDVSSMNNLTITQQSGNTLVTWQQQVAQPESATVTEHESILLKNVIAAKLQASDFILHVA